MQDLEALRNFDMNSSFVILIIISYRISVSVKEYYP